VLLYDMLLALAPSPVTRLHRAIALRYASGPGAAMAELDTLAGALGSTTPPAPSCCVSSATPTRPATRTGSP
jgi:hypothetical protein